METMMNYLETICKTYPTTCELCEQCSIDAYYAVRADLAKLQKDGLIDRRPETRWRWFLTAAGQAAVRNGGRR